MTTKQQGAKQQGPDGRPIKKSGPLVVAAVGGLLLSLPVVLAGCGQEDPRDGRQLVVRSSLHRQVEKEASEQSAAQTGVDEKKLIETYQLTVHPIVAKNCSLCHASRVAPFFADTDPVKSYLALVNGKKVDFTTPSNSRIVQRLSIEGHNCWSDCVANSAEILEAIKKWSADSGSAAAQTTNFKFVTPEVTKADMFKTYLAEPAPAPGATPAPPGLNELVVEAESLTMPKGWQVATDFRTIPATPPATQPTRTEFQYVTALQGGNTLTPEEVDKATDLAEFSVVFFAPTQADYTLYIRAAGLPGNANEYFYKIDNDPV